MPEPSHGPPRVGGARSFHISLDVASRWWQHLNLEARTILGPCFALARAGLLLGLGALALLSGTRASQAQGPIEMGLDTEVTGNTPSVLGVHPVVLPAGLERHIL